MPTTTELAWLAGLIDGEGTVALSHGGDGSSPHLRIQFYSSSDAILEKAIGILRSIPGVTYYAKWDRRHPVANCSVLIGTAAVLLLYPLIRPYLVRQVGRLDAAHTFLAPRYEGRIRVRWSAADRAAWAALRATYNAA